VINHYMQHPQSKLLGVTATPDRLDNLALGQVFESVAYSYDVSDGIRDGWLVPVHQRFVQCDDLDLSEVATSGGDLKLCDLERELEKSLQSMVLPLVEIAGTRRALIFAATVKHAERICEIINRSGLNTGAAAIVHGNTPREVRKDIFSAFGEGKYQYLVNVAVATEGWDDPALDGKGVQIIGMMCPTKSRARYSQMLGRGTRTLPGTVDGIEDAQGRKDAIAASAKSRMLVLDFLGNSGRHTLIHAGDVLGGKMDEKVMARYRRESEKKGVPEEIDVLAELSHADREHRKALEARTRERIIGRAKYSSQEVDPFERLGIVPANTPWWMKRIPATVKQRAMLERSGLALPKDIDTGRASQLIEHIMSRPSDKQAFVLRRAGVDPTGMSRRQASEAIDKVMNS
jgi:superfamily II DNA or RNA helicase